MILIPFLPFRRAAESLETDDLQRNISAIRAELVANKGVWYDVTLAEYGLTSLKVLSSRGLRNDLYYKLFKDAYHGTPVDPPLWLKDFTTNHRKHLVLLGWLRHFEERGAKHFFCQENGIEHPLVTIQRCKKPLSIFKALDSRLTSLGLFERTRQYHRFVEEPEVVQLSP